MSSWRCSPTIRPYLHPNLTLNPNLTLSIYPSYPNPEPNHEVCLFSTMLSIFGPLLALRGGDGAVHTAVQGMQLWTRAVLALFMFSLLLLQLSALSMVYGHQLGDIDMLVVLAVMILMVAVNGVYARKVLRTFALPPGEQWVSGSYFVDTERHGEGRAPQSSMFADGGLSRRRGRCLATRLAEDEAAPLTAESLDAAIMEVDATHALDGSKGPLNGSLPSSSLDGRMASTEEPRHGAPQQRRRLSVWQQWAAAWAGLAPVAATGADATYRLQSAAVAAAGSAGSAAVVGAHRLLLGSSRPSYRRPQRPWLGRR